MTVPRVFQGSGRAGLFALTLPLHPKAGGFFDPPLLSPPASEFGPLTVRQATDSSPLGAGRSCQRVSAVL